MVIRRFLQGFLNGSKRPRANNVATGSVRSHHLDILRHWISVDSRYLPSEFGSNGVLSVYTNEEDCASGITVFSQTGALTEGKGEYLYAHVTRSLPPPDASRDLEDEAYTEQWMHNCPIYNDKDVVVSCSVLHDIFPDGIDPSKTRFVYGQATDSNGMDSSSP